MMLPTTGSLGVWLTTRRTVAVALALALWVAVGIAQPARAASYFVTTPAELQAAINDAEATSSASTITLAPVVFHIGNTISEVDICGSSAITLIGAGASSTILDGDFSGNDVVRISCTGGNTTIENVTIQNSATSDGIYDNGGLVLIDSVVRNNGSTGIETVDQGLAIYTSTISGNGLYQPTQQLLNGGIYIESPFSAVNSTITGNQNNGIFVDCACGGGASLTNVTIDSNAGAGLAAGGSITVTNTIIADNTGGNCTAPSGTQRATSGGHNLIGDLSCGFTAAGDLSGVSPQLGPLQDNGGPTPTMALSVSSPAVDAGDDSACPSTDQRGVTRPQGTACDIGAYELVKVVAINQAYSTPFNTPLTVAAPGLLSGDSGLPITVTGTSAPSHGTLSFGADGSFIYTPTTGFSGTDTFIYTITDSASQTASATVTITVAPPPLPVAINHTYSTPFNTPLTVAAPGLLSGDSGVPITVTSTTTPGHGTLSFGADGSFTYTPTTGFSGTDTFNYTITDSASQTASATVTITVSPSSFDVKLTLSPRGIFTSGQVAAFFVTVTNTGTVATSGTLTFTDTLPAGLTYVSGVGPGWTCSVASQTVTCTYANPLAAHRSTGLVLSVIVTAPRGMVLTDTGTVTPLDATPADNTASVRGAVK